MSTQRVRSLYGAADGTWMFVETPPNTITPATITVGIPGVSPSTGTTRALEHLGAPHDVFTRIYLDVAAMPTVGLRGRRGVIPVQQAIGDMLGGVSQQSVSRYINGQSEPALSDDHWRLLVRISFDPALLISAMTRGGAR